MSMLQMKIKVYEAQTKEGKKFNYFKAVQKNGTLIDVRFRKDVSPLPKEDCLLYVNATDVNKDTQRVFPCLWVKEIQRIAPLEVKNKVDKDVVEMFETVEDKKDPSESDLPF